MSTRLKRIAGMLVAAVVLSMAALCVLASVTEAQNVPAGPVEDTQSTNQDAEASAILRPQASESPAVRLVVPGDSLWLIAQEHLGPDATPGQVMNEVELLYELNRDQIGDDPNLIFPGQELLLPPVAEPEAVPELATSEAGAPSEPEVVSEPEAVLEPANEPASETATPEQPAAKSEVDESMQAPAAPSSESDNSEERRMVGLGILLLTFVVAALGVVRVWRGLAMKRHEPLGDDWNRAYYEAYAPYAPARHQEQQETSEPEAVVEPAAAKEKTLETAAAELRPDTPAVPRDDHTWRRLRARRFRARQLRAQRRFDESSSGGGGGVGGG